MYSSTSWCWGTLTPPTVALGKQPLLELLYLLQVAGIVAELHLWLGTTAAASSCLGRLPDPNAATAAVTDAKEPSRACGVLSHGDV